MLRDTIEKLEARLRDSESLPEARRRELLDLLGQLQEEIGGLAESHAEDAERIAGLASQSAHEATQEPRNEGALRQAITSLNESVEGFEASHPRLVQAVNTMASTLANWGI